MTVPEVFNVADVPVTRPSHPLAVIDERMLTITLSTDAEGWGHHQYEIDLETCQTPADVLNWIFQVRAKSWATPMMMMDLITAFNEAFRRWHGGGVQGALICRDGPVEWPAGDEGSLP